MEQSYKEKYEQALAKLRGLIDGIHEEKCEIVEDDIIDIFPELAESEDEKVRKELIKHLKELSDWKEDEVIPVKNPSYYRQWASWLEKQEEHANFLSKIQVGDKVTRNEDGVLVNLSQLKRVAKPREKQCEQKFEMKTAEESLGIDSDTYNKIVDECVFGEEDEAVLDALIRRLKGEDIYVSPHLAVECLESLKGRVQPKQEWGEEDEEHIDSLLKRLDALCRNKFERTRFAISEDREWLKSLRPQNNITDEELTQAKKNAYNNALDKIEYHSGEPTFDDGWSAAIDYIRKKSIRPQNKWKPSDEHIGLLQAIINEPNNAASESCQIVLKDILEQLKKLKEGKI